MAQTQFGPSLLLDCAPLRHDGLDQSRPKPYKEASLKFMALNATSKAR
jgi:hypothetical protein